MLPESLKIGFEIFRVGNTTADVPDAGQCHVELGTIQVAARMTARRRVSTLIHEILHALWDQAELPQEDDRDLTGLREEDVIKRLSGGLTQVLLDNLPLRDCLEQAANDRNSTALNWSESSASRPFTAAEMADAMHGAIQHLRQERVENALVDNSDNAPRSAPKGMSCDCNGPCYTFPNCCFPVT